MTRAAPGPPGAVLFPWALSRRALGRLAGAAALVPLSACGRGGSPWTSSVPALVQGLPPGGRTAGATGATASGAAGGGLAARALSDLLALDGPFPDVADPDGRHPTSAGVAGAAIAAWAPFWRYVWPRDASFAAAALSGAGRRTEAAAVLDFLARVAPPDGAWAARYLPDGSGRVPDDRSPQGDSAGWVCWAVWAGASRDPGRGVRWASMVTASANRIAGSLDRVGEPPASSDYWEVGADGVTVETVTASLVGLRAAAALAGGWGRPDDGKRWSAAAHRVAGALAERWAPAGYPRTLPDGGADAAVGLLAGLAPDLPGVAEAAARAARELRLPNGGMRPGTAWPHDDGVAWTPETAMLALGAARAEPALAREQLSWLDAHRTTAGSLPEKVGPDGAPASVAPLGWTCALVLLAQAAATGTGPPAPPAPPA